MEEIENKGEEVFANEDGGLGLLIMIVVGSLALLRLFIVVVQRVELVEE